MLAVSPVRAEQFFVTRVVAYQPGPGVTAGQGFGVPDRILGGPRGGGTTAGAVDVLTLGVGGSVTVAFDDGTHERLIVDGPGPDFIVFENPFYIGGNPQNVFAELAFVEVSSDGVQFARFPVLSATASAVGPFSGIDPADVRGFAGVHPVLANVDINTIDPFDPAAAGGDAFDLADLQSDPLVQSGAVLLNAIRFVRIIDVLGDGSVTDGAGRPVYDATGFNNACDIDAVSVIHGCTPGDLTGDGAVDGADAAALASVLLEAASASACADLNHDGRIDGEDIQAILAAMVIP